MPEASIPRIIHRIWLGPNPLSEEDAEYGESWRRHHPEWEMRLWTDDDLVDLDMPDAFQRTSHPVTRSDVLRLEILRRFGGVYVDTDIECRKPIDSLLDGISAFAAYQQPDRDLINNGLMGSVPGHPTIERAVREAMENIGPEYSFAATATEFITPIFEGSPDVFIFGSELFHPYKPNERHRSGDEFPEAYAVHHWSGSWKSREWYEAQKERSRARMRRLQERVEKLKRRREALRAELSGAELRIEQLERRISAIESTRWWRLRRRLGSVARLVRR